MEWCKKLLWGLCVLSLTCGRAAYGIGFDAVSHDFGVIDEIDGKVSHRFHFVNDSTSPVTIIRAEASCNCVQASYDPSPVQPGGRGTVTVTIDPKGQTRDFRRRVEVYYASETARGSVTLTVSATIDYTDPPEVEYPYPIAGGLRADRLFIPAGHLMYGENPKNLTFRIYNDSPRTMRLRARIVNRSGIVSVQVPERIAPGQKAVAEAKITVLPGFHGNFRDSLYISVDGVEGACAMIAGFAADPPEKPLPLFNPRKKNK